MGKNNNMYKRFKTKKVTNKTNPPEPWMMDFAEDYFNDMFGGLEEITDELIKELVDDGKYPEHVLIEARQNKLLYSRKRNSFVSGTDLIWDE